MARPVEPLTPLWHETAPPFAGPAIGTALDTDSVHDTIVIGAGVTGLSDGAATSPSTGAA